MRFSHFYRKLEDKKFTTIRKYKRYNKGDKLSIYVGKDYQGRVIINEIWKRTFNELPLGLLIDDMKPFCKTKEECFSFLQGFYKKPIDKERDKLIIYFLEWV